MRIGIDMDGVLTELESWRIDHGSKYFLETYNMKIYDNKGYDIREIFNVDNNLDNEFWTKYYVEYSKKVPAKRFASEVINKLKEEGNEIYIITARGSHLESFNNVITFEQSNDIVYEWFKENNIPYDKIIFSKEDKKELCLENNIDIMIEDKPRNILDISQVIPVICYNAGYNEKCSGETIHRCFSWFDIYAKINELNNN